MAATIVVIILIVLVALVVLEVTMAHTTTLVDTTLTPSEAADVVDGYFNPRFNRISVENLGRRITPRLKRDPPTLKVDIAPIDSGSRVEMAATFVVEKRGCLPWIPKHGLWIWRKQRAAARALFAVTSSLVDNE